MMLTWRNISCRRYITFVISKKNTIKLTSFYFQDDLSGADIKAICTEAGLLALRERRMKVTQEDFKQSKENVLYRKQEGTPEGLYM